MRNGILLAGIAFAVASAIVIGNRLSNEAMAVVVGAVCGISASIPVSVGFLIAASRHWGRESGSESGRMTPSPELSRYAQPPVVVIAPPQPSHSPYFNQSQFYLPPGAPPLGAPRDFKIVGDD